MNLLLVSNRFPPAAHGGVEIYTYHLAKGLYGKGHKVHVFCRESDIHRPDYEIIEENIDGIAVIRVINDFKNLTQYTNTYVDEKIESIFANVMQKISPQLVHFHHTIGLSALLPQITAEHGIPGVFTLHDFWPICHRVNLFNREDHFCPGPYQGGDCQDCVFGPGERSVIHSLMVMGKKITPPAFRRSIRKVLGTADNQTPIVHSEPDVDTFENRHALFRKSLLSTQKLLSPSEFVRDQFALNKYPGERIDVLPLSTKVPGPTSQQRRDEDGGKIKIAFIGSLIYGKGIDILIRAFRRVPGKNLTLSIYGRDDTEPVSYVNQLKALANTDSRIKLRGSFPPEKRGDVYRAIDVLVLPSRVPETFSLVTHEALSVGKPVIASNIGAIPEAVIDGANGFLFEPGNIDQLTMILGRIKDNPEILEKLNCPGPANITIDEEHINELLQIYNTILTGTPQDNEAIY